MKSLMVLVAATLAALPLAAQHDHPAPPPGRTDSGARPPMAGAMPRMAPGGMPGMHGDGMGMHAGPMLFAPAHLLARKDKLNLTAQQVTRLEALRDGARAAHDRAASVARVAGDSLHTALAAAAPDTALARRLFRAHHDAMGEAHWVMLRVSAQAKAVLTDAQRGRVEGWGDAMHDGRH